MVTKGFNSLDPIPTFLNLKIITMITFENFLAERPELLELSIDEQLTAYQDYVETYTLAWASFD